MLVLMMRDECHLCDLALTELAAAGVRGLQACYIDGDEVLERRYGERVPVLCDGQGRELDWPFTTVSVLAWLEGESAGP